MTARRPASNRTPSASRSAHVLPRWLEPALGTTEGGTMTTTHDAEPNQELPPGDLRLLETDLAQRLLQSAIPARLAFVWVDGTPRVVPTWFPWTHREGVMVSYG